MGNIIKINIYAELKRNKKDLLNLKAVQEVILDYNVWIKNTNRDDKIYNYVRFLKAK